MNLVSTHLLSFNGLSPPPSFSSLWWPSLFEDPWRRPPCGGEALPASPVGGQAIIRGGDSGLPGNRNPLAFLGAAAGCIAWCCAGCGTRRALPPRAWLLRAASPCSSRNPRRSLCLPRVVTGCRGLGRSAAHPRAPACVGIFTGTGVIADGYCILCAALDRRCGRSPDITGAPSSGTPPRSSLERYSRGWGWFDGWPVAAIRGPCGASGRDIDEPGSQCRGGGPDDRLCRLGTFGDGSDHLDVDLRVVRSQSPTSTTQPVGRRSAF